ncbi:tyrosine-type recombinase/integrase [Paenibacillus sp. IHB B 3415]|uniref:tyrosine-type recombinase/integrase n=1 Tax=Paenibacillus sp. IHB B 3415 TaxID=867080 RepID=UPI0009F84518
MGEKKLILPKFLEKNELELFLQLCRFVLSITPWALFVILTYAGLRISEATGLQWEDIDMKKRTIDINKQIGSSVKEYSSPPPPDYNGKTLT